jgi:hypothetical protein
MRAPGLLCGWLIVAGLARGAEPLAAPAKGEAELRRELREAWKVLDSREGTSSAERGAASDVLDTCRDHRATDVLFELWEKEKELRHDARWSLIRGLQSIAEAGDPKAFRKVAEISIEDANPEFRRLAAIWVGTQANRDLAIPIFAKYLKLKKYGNVAMESLGYTQICQHPKGPPDPDLVAGMIDKLITVKAVNKRRVRVQGPTRVQRFPAGRIWETRSNYVLLFDFVQEENANTRDLLYRYTAQDHGFDQEAWKKNVLTPLRASAITNQRAVRQDQQ